LLDLVLLLVVRELREARIVERLSDSVEHGAERGRARAIFVAHPDDGIELRQVVASLQATCGDLPRKARLAHPSKAGN